MKHGLKILLLSVFIFSCALMLSGCWNYREVDKLAIVAGVAIDKENDKYLVTMEIANPTGGRDVKIESKLISMTGDTIFDAVRNLIKVSGKKSYWSHVKVVIISQDIAREGVIQAIDWFGRDSETRLSTNILISKGKTAKEILEQQAKISEVRSFEIYDMLTSQVSLSKAPNVQIYEFIGDLAAEGKSATLPAIGFTVNEGQTVPELCGMAIFKADKLIGFLDEEDTRYFLIVINEVKGGLIVHKEEPESRHSDITLEIFGDLTNSRIKPVYSEGKLTMKLDVYIIASIGELETTENDIDEPGFSKLEKDIERSLQNNIIRVIKKVQNEYDSDIFGFGSITKGGMPNIWRSMEKDWDKNFKDLDVNVSIHLKIENSAQAAKPIKKGD